MKNILLEASLADGFEQVYRIGFEIGYIRGIELGKLIGRQDIALTVLEARFGPVSATLQAHVFGLDPDALRQLILRAVKAHSLEDAGLARFAE